MFCKNCGENINENSKFCIKCGKPVMTSSLLNNPPSVDSFGSVTNEVRAGNHEKLDVGSMSMEQIANKYKPVTPPGAFGGVTPEQMKENIIASEVEHVYVEMQASNHSKPKTISPSIEYRCPNCGKIIPSFNINYDNCTAFCSCGKKGLLVEFAPAQQNIQRKKSPVKILAVAGAVVAVLAVVWLCISLFLSDFDVYACGYVEDKEGRKSVYWKNGNLIELPSRGYDNARAYSIYVSGKDVYVCGYTDEKAAYWKNGNLVELPSRGYDYAGAFSIYVSGKDVYVCGYTEEKAAYWKNGTLIELPSRGYDGAGAISIYVSGNDVYICGYVKDKVGRKPVYWKNGNLVELPSRGYDDAFTTSIYVSGNNVYVCGFLTYDKAEDNSKAAYWRNGELVELPSRGYDDAVAGSIYVSGKDVYVCGYADERAAYWKNGELTRLPGYDLNQTRLVFVSGKDVYVVGRLYEGKTEKVFIVLWKNSSTERLYEAGDSTTYITGAFLKKKLLSFFGL
jgi:hypothetical protein